MYYDVIIAGAGPAGLFAAIAAADRGARVLLLEAMSDGGRKLLISGSGQCNLTHSAPVQDLLQHYGLPGSARQKECARFLRSALYMFSNEQLLNFFEQRSLGMEHCDNGKVFPVTRRAKDVHAVLLNEIHVRGVEYRCSAPLLSVLKDTCFSVSCAATSDPVSTASLILATGGLSYPSTGSSGDGFRIAKTLGHKIIPVTPALAPVYIQAAAYKTFIECSGIAIRKTRITVFRDGKKTLSNSGDLLFTHTGLSGPLILDASRNIRAGDCITAAFLPEFQTAEAAEEALVYATQEQGKRLLLNCIRSFGLPERICTALFICLEIPLDLQAARMDKQTRKKLAWSFSGTPGGVSFPVAKLGGWNEAMASRGGICLDEVNPKRMESRVLPGLYFAGEIMDIDGDSGGYNIQAACSTGYLAGLCAAESSR